MKVSIFICFMLICNYISAQKTKITINVIGIEKIKGSMCIMVLNEKENELEKRVIPIKNNKLNLEIEYNIGQKIAIKVFQDLNNDQKLGTNSLGFPNEPWGVSNDVKPFLGPPNFQKMLFTINPKIKNITIKLQ